MVQEAWKAGATKCLSKANCTPKQRHRMVVARSTIEATAPAPRLPRPRPPSPHRTARPAPPRDPRRRQAIATS